MNENIEHNSLNHPYTEFKNTPLWAVIDKSLSELEQNQDVELFTLREYVIGYICKQITEDLQSEK